MKVLIVGGVAGGAGAAARLRRNDEACEIVLLEKGEYISFANCGLPYYIGGVISEPDALLLQTPEGFRDRFRVDVRTGQEVTAVDPAAHTVTIKNRRTGETQVERYDKLVLSPGARPAVPPIPGVEGPQVFTLRNIPDTFKIKTFLQHRAPKTAAVIGGGYVGLEMAENLRAAGTQVAVIEAAEHVIAPLDAEMAHAVHTHLRENGVSLYLGSQAQSIEPGAVTLSDGTVVPAELVILSVGVTPETDFLVGSGIELGPRGAIVVDEQMHTSCPDIWAVGDAVLVKSLVTGEARAVPLASPANRQARIAADALCGRPVRYSGAQSTAIAKIFELSVAVTGENEAALRRAGVPYRKSYTFSPSHAGYYPGGSLLCLKLLFGLDGRVLGGQITGREGVDKRIDLLAAVLRMGGTVYDLQELELAYAPPYSSAKDPVNMAGYVAANILEGLMKPFYLEDLPTLSSGDLLVDVRTPEEFAAGHLPGALNLPLDELRGRLPELPQGKTLWLYCHVGQRGYLAQRILEQNGFTTRNLSGGYLLWEAMQQDAQ